MENILKEKNILIGKPDITSKTGYTINFETGEILGLSEKTVRYFNRNFLMLLEGYIYSNTEHDNLFYLCQSIFSYAHQFNRTKNLAFPEEKELFQIMEKISYFNVSFDFSGMSSSQLPNFITDLKLLKISSKITEGFSITDYRIYPASLRLYKLYEILQYDTTLLLNQGKLLRSLDTIYFQTKNLAYIQYLFKKNKTEFFMMLNDFSSLAVEYYLTQMEIYDKVIFEKNFLISALMFKFKYEELRKDIFNAKLQKIDYNRFIFSDVNYTVIIPTKVQDILEEGEQQHNCIYRNYISAIVNEKIYTVFIRKNSAIEKSYITCTFYIDTYEINDYRLAYNKQVYNSEDLTFIEKYQNFLYSIR